MCCSCAYVAPSVPCELAGFDMHVQKSVLHSLHAVKNKMCHTTLVPSSSAGADINSAIESGCYIFATCTHQHKYVSESELVNGTRVCEYNLCGAYKLNTYLGCWWLAAAVSVLLLRRLDGGRGVHRHKLILFFCWFARMCVYHIQHTTRARSAHRTSSGTFKLDHFCWVDACVCVRETRSRGRVHFSRFMHTQLGNACAC